MKTYSIGYERQLFGRIEIDLFRYYGLTFGFIYDVAYREIQIGLQVLFISILWKKG